MKFPGLFAFLVGTIGVDEFGVNAEETKVARSLQTALAKVGNNGVGNNGELDTFPLGNCQG
jgi:hypothetical protein